LQALENPEMVFIKGRKLDREVLTKFEEKSKNRNNFILTVFIYIENMIVER
jgi:hypothetical protein